MTEYNFGYLKNSPAECGSKSDKCLISFFSTSDFSIRLKVHFYDFQPSESDFNKKSSKPTTDNSESTEKNEFIQLGMFFISIEGIILRKSKNDQRSFTLQSKEKKYYTNRMHQIPDPFFSGNLSTRVSRLFSRTHPYILLFMKENGMKKA